jgi:hypothetical protein
MSKDENPATRYGWLALKKGHPALGYSGNPPRGYLQHRSLHRALAAWELTIYVIKPSSSSFDILVMSSRFTFQIL